MSTAGPRRLDGDVLEITIANERAEIPRVTDEVEAFARRHDLAPPVVHDVLVCIDEVLSNIVRHAIVEPGPHAIGIRVALEAGALVTEITDDGQAFDPVGHAAREHDAAPERRRDGGLGIYFLKQLMDELTYRREGASNHLVMKKWVFPGRDPARGAPGGHGDAMDVGVELLGEVVRVAPRGRIDSSTAEQFSEHLDRVIASGCRSLVIDFRDVQFITSAGFRSLLVAEARLHESEGRLALCGLAKEVQRLFEIGAFTDNFTILPTLEECVARLAGSSRPSR